MKLKKTLQASRLIAIGFSSLLAIPVQAGTYTWTGATSGTWGADATNWTSSIAGVPGVTDTAVIGNSSTNQTILLTSAATTGTIAGLNFTQTTEGVTNTLQITRPGSNSGAASLSVSGTGFTLGGGDPLAVTQLYLDPSLNQSVAGVSGTNIYLNVNNVTVAAGGILKLGAYVYLSGGTYYANASTVSGNVNIAGGSLLMPNAVNITGSGPGSYSNTINGSLTMTSGTISIGDGTTAVSNRLYVGGNFNVSGGTIYVGVNDQISLNGATNVISGSATLNTGAGLMLFANNASFSSSTYVGNLAARSSGTATISSSAAGNQFGSLSFGVSGSNGVATIKLGTNLTALNVTAGYGVSTGSSATTVNYATDLNNNTLSVTGGTLQPNSVYSNSANWYFGNSGTGTGTIIAGFYNFATTNIQTNVGLNSVGTVVLTATGNNGTNYLGSATSGTIAPNTTFLYTGSTASLTSGRQIGRLAVGSGSTSYLGVTGTALQVGGDITLNANSTLGLAGYNVTETAATGGTTGGLNGSGAVRSVSVTGSNSTLTLNTANGNGSYSGSIYNSNTNGAISVTVMGGKTQVFAGNQTSSYTGVTTIAGDGSTLQLGDGTTDASINVSNITNNGSLVYNVVGSGTTGGVISGTGSVTKTGTGSEYLTGSNTYTGVTTINGGELRLGNNGTTGSLSGSGAIINNGQLTFSRSNGAVQGVDFGTTISGTGNIMVLYKGVTLGDGNTFTGFTAINSGVLNASSIAVTGGSSSLGNATSAVGLGGPSASGTLNYTGNSATYTRGFTVSLKSGEFDTATAGQTTTISTAGATVASGGVFAIGGAGNTVVSSTISGAGGFKAVGSGTVSLATLNTYTGVTYISRRRHTARWAERRRAADGHRADDRRDG